MIRIWTKSLPFKVYSHVYLCIFNKFFKQRFSSWTEMIILKDYTVLPLERSSFTSNYHTIIPQIPVFHTAYLGPDSARYLCKCLTLCIWVVPLTLMGQCICLKLGSCLRTLPSWYLEHKITVVFHVSAYGSCWTYSWPSVEPCAAMYTPLLLYIDMKSLLAQCLEKSLLILH